MNIEPSALIYFILYSKRAYYSYNKEYGLNKSDLEVMAYATRHKIFNTYEAWTFFNQMNVQQLRRTIQKLVNLMILEIIRPGSKSKPALYILTEKGEEQILRYIEMWNSF
jgi:DNA-binding PadR family transcriptional regulator